jgi:hypothetical protein
MRITAFATLVLALAAAPAPAQRGPFGMGQDLRLEGIVEPANDAKVLGRIKVVAGDQTRKLGVIRAQTPRAEGMALFRRSSLNPFQLLLRGDAAQLATFASAPAGTRLRMLGRYTGDDFILAEITVVPPPTAGAGGT